MTTTIIIIILTFIYTILDKFILGSERQPDKNVKANFFYRIIKSRYTLMVLLLGLLGFQIISEYSSNETDKVRNNNASNAYDTLYLTHDNVKKINSSVDSLFLSIDSTLKITKDELKLISNVNNDLENVRHGIKNSIDEFKSIKDQYEKQIKIEKEKIREAKPNLEVAYSKCNMDSTSFSYTFELFNSGVRLADSIIYHSLIILVDSNLILRDICLYKTNSDEGNILSISHVDNWSNSKIFNSGSIEIKNINALSKAYLLLSYTYKDNMTNDTKNEFNIYQTSSFEQGKRQFGINIKDFEKETIKLHLLKNNKRLYTLFYK